MKLPPTETVDPTTRSLDELTTPQLIVTLTAAHRRAFDAVAKAEPQLVAAVESVASRLAAGGRLRYVGAGTSGRLGMLDAAECPPTFGTAPEQVQAHIAGGAGALLRAVEGAEDDIESGRASVEDVNANDVVVGISASGGAPYVVAAVTHARERGALTIALTNDADSALASAAEAQIVLATGAEPLAGSTRLVAGTAQKMALGILSTAAMVRLGHVYDNVMVDVVATNAKLRSRALRLLTNLTELDEIRAAELLENCGGRVKVAVLAARRSLEPHAARAHLEAVNGSLRTALTREPDPRSGGADASGDEANTNTTSLDVHRGN